MKVAAKRSAGLLLVRASAEGLEVLLVHPGGPFFRNKDAGAWSIPKGLIEAAEEPLDTAKRELVEETGFTLPAGPYLSIGEIRQKGGKEVVAWAVRGEADPAALVSNTFEIQWPPRSGRMQSFPEVDRAGWFARPAAEEKMNPAQHPFLDRAAALRDALGL